MKTAKTRAKKIESKGVGAAPKHEQGGELAAPPVLGIIPRGELHEVELARIVEPHGTPDRMERPEDAQEIQEIARSMREVGQLQPVMVEQLVDGRFARVFGRRRIAAARINGSTNVLAIVVPPLPDDVRRTIVAVENIQRKDLSPAEEHLAVAELMELQAVDAAVQVKGKLDEHAGDYFNVAVGDIVADEIRSMGQDRQKESREMLLGDHRVRARACELVAAMLAKSATWVRDRMYIGRLGAKARDLVLSGKLPLAHAREIAKVSDAAIRDDLAKSFAAGGDESISDTEAGELDELRHEVGQRVFTLTVVPWKLDEPVMGLRPCEGCQHNSTTNPGLFDHGGHSSTEMVGGIGRYGREVNRKDQAAGVCTLHSCYATKLRATKAAVSAAAKRIVDQDRDPKKDPRVVAPFVADKALADKVKSRRALVGSRKKSGSGASSSNGAAAKAETAESKLKRDAEVGFDEALLHWFYEGVQALAGAAKKEPELSVALHLLDLAEPWNKASCWDKVAGEVELKVMRTPSFVRMLECVKKRDAVGLVALIGQQSNLLSKYPDFGNDVSAEALGLLLAAAGVDPKAPMPKLETFLAQVKAEHAAAEEKTPAKKKPHAKKKAAKAGKEK